MNQKGQVQIIFLIILIVIAVVFFTRGFDKDSLPAERSKTETLRSEPQEQIKSPEPEQEVDLLPLPPDTAPPQRFNLKPSGELPAETRQITMSLETDEKAFCRYSTVSGVYYEYMQGKFDQTGNTFHSVLITTLSAGEEYVYYIRCIDEHGNKNMDDSEISFEVKMPKDTTPPVRLYLSHTGDVLPAGTTKVTISISTDEPAVCRYDTSQGTDYQSMKNRFSHYDQTKHFHVATIKNLEDGKYYAYFVRCIDEAGNKNTGDVMISFSVEAQ